MGLNLLLVHHAWPPGGGSETYVRGLAHALSGRHRVSVLHRGVDPAKPDHVVTERHEGAVRVLALNNLHRAYPGFESWSDLGVTAAFERVVAGVKPDVVHVSHLSGLSAGIVPAAREAGAAVVFTLHDFATLCPLGQLLDLKLRVCPGPSPSRCRGCVGGQVAAPASLAGAGRGVATLPGMARVAGLLGRAGLGSERIARRLDAMHDVLRQADVLVAPSRFLRDRFAALGVSGIEVVPNGHPPLPAAPRHADPAGRLRLGFMGSAIPSKGVHVLAEAFVRLADPRASLQIHGPFVPYHGDATYEAQVRALLGPRAAEAIRGPYAHEQRAEVLAGFDVLVAPSLWEENAPLVVQEAFQAGIPVVASGHGGLAEAVRHGIDGLHFEPGDAGALADVLRRLLDEPGLRDRLARGAPAVTTMDEHVAAIEDVYATARRRHRGRPGRVGVVVVDHGRPRDAALAIASAQDPALDPRLLIVENGAGPDGAGDPSAGNGAAPRLRLEQNLGYAGGANAGLRRLIEEGCDRVLLLNNDARLEKGALRRLAEALDDPMVAASGPTIVGPDGSVESRGIRIDLATGRHRLAGHRGRPDERSARDPDALSGAALMVSAAAVQRLGGLDESYFHGCEDTDFCIRAREAGFRIALAPEARVRHESGATLGRGAPDRLYYGVRNHLRLVDRRRPLSGAAHALRRAVIGALHVAHALRQRDLPAGAALRAIRSGIADHRRGRSGPRAPS